MNDAARKAKNAYQREWRKRNREKVKMHNERYWTKQGEEMACRDGGRIATV